MWILLLVYFEASVSTDENMISFDESTRIEVSIDQALLEMSFFPVNTDSYGLRVHDIVITWSAKPTPSGVRFRCVGEAVQPLPSWTTTNPEYVNTTCRDNGEAVQPVLYDTIPAYPEMEEMPSVGVIIPSPGGVESVCGSIITSQVWSVILYHGTILSLWCNGDMSFFVNLNILLSNVNLKSVLPISFLGSRGKYRYSWMKFSMLSSFLTEDIGNLNLHFDEDDVLDLELMSYRFFESALLPKNGSLHSFVINTVLILNYNTILTTTINQTGHVLSAFNTRLSVNNIKPRWNKKYDSFVHGDSNCPRCHQIVFRMTVKRKTVTVKCSCGQNSNRGTGTLASFTLPPRTIPIHSNITSLTINNLGVKNPSLLGKLIRAPCTWATIAAPGNYSSQYRLISEGKPVRSSTQSKTGSARSIVDGNTSGRTFVPIGILCSQELHRNTPQWLEINLLQDMIVHVVIITQVDPLFNCEVYKKRVLAGSQVMVNKILCGFVPSAGNLSKEIVIRCDTPLIGSNVYFKSGPSNSITLCEIQVYGEEIEQPDFITISPKGVFDKISGENLNETFGFHLNQADNFTEIRVIVKGKKTEAKMECSDGNQVAYSGALNVTYSGRACSPWKLHGRPEDENFCRNPDGAKKGVWCYLSPTGGAWEYCALSRCNCSGPESTDPGSMPAESVWGTLCSVNGSPATCRADIPPPSYQANVQQDDDSRGDLKIFHNAQVRRSPPWCMVNTTHWEFCYGGSRCTNDKVVFKIPELGVDGYNVAGTRTNIRDIRIRVTGINLTKTEVVSVTFHLNGISPPYRILVPVVVSDPQMDFQPQRFVVPGSTACILYVRKRDPLFKSFLMDHENVVLCPNHQKAYTRKFSNDFCYFSKRCPEDEPNFQACGCSQVKAPYHNDRGFFLKTIICRPVFMKTNKDDLYRFSPIQTSLLCDGLDDCSSKFPGTMVSLDEHCEDGSDKPQGDTDDNFFSCYEGDPISLSKVCNGYPDCSYSYALSQTGEKQYFYEDELKCPNPNDVICQRFIGMKFVRILVPPRYQCDETISCSTRRKETEGCIEVGRCTVTQANGVAEEKMLYAPYMCDRTYQYCDNWKATMYNCTNKQPEIIPTLTCERGGAEITIITQMECDGEDDCDDGIDEECLIISQSCKINIRHLTQPLKILAEIYKNIAGCNGITDRRSADSVSENLPALIFEGFTGVEFVPCPRQPGKYVLIKHICDHLDTCAPYVMDAVYPSEEEACLVYKFIPASVTLTSPSYHSFMPECLPGISIQGSCTDIIRNMGFITNPALRVEVNKSYDCSRISGRAFALLKCNGSCSSKGSCPLQPITSECHNQETGEGYSLTMVPNIRGNNASIVYHSDPGKDFRGKFPCSFSRQCVDIDLICNHQNDCLDLSDEGGMCDNKFSCRDKYQTFIPMSMKCNRQFDCKSREDECNEECWMRILNEPWMRVAALFIGITATLINLLSLFIFFRKVGKAPSLSAITNDCMVALISLGDLIVGVYMLVLFVMDVQTQQSFCPDRYEWFGSWECNIFGVMSTFGNILSLLSMTFLSLFRIISLKTMMIFSDVSTVNILKVVGILVFVVAWSLTIAIIPTVEEFEDYFVNGLYFASNPLYMDIVTRDIFNRTLDTWNMSYTNMSKKTSWSFWRNATERVFGKDNNQTTKSIPIGFYGTDGVCLFKYFVTVKDPQWHFSMFVLMQNLICFVIITVCYTLIILHTTSSSQVRGEGNDANPAMARLQRKISMIIATDFTTWIPFITIALVHFLELADMTTLYSFCSIVLLPVNSVLNPLIYNGDVVIERLRDAIRTPRRAVRSLSKIVRPSSSGKSYADQST